MEKGMEKGIRETAVELLKMGVVEEIVVESTGLTIEEIKENIMN